MSVIEVIEADGPPAKYTMYDEISTHRYLQINVPQFLFPPTV